MIPKTFQRGSWQTRCRSLTAFCTLYFCITCFTSCQASLKLSVIYSVHNEWLRIKPYCVAHFISVNVPFCHIKRHWFISQPLRRFHWIKVKRWLWRFIGTSISYLFLSFSRVIINAAAVQRECLYQVYYLWAGKLLPVVYFKNEISIRTLHPVSVGLCVLQEVCRLHLSMCYVASFFP